MALQSAAAPPAADPSAKCRVGAGGAPVGPIQAADRGIGGTGAPAPPQLAERGIGGTGIIGVITGFASVCLNGVEVSLGQGAAVEADGRDAAARDLRAGQLAVIEAGGASASLEARKVLIRHEVSGPVEKVTLDPGNDRRVLQVAGQQVLVPGWVWGDQDVKAGDWVEVSGLRRFDTSIEATRLDRRLRGRVLVHGRLSDRAGFAVGNLAIRSDFDLRPYVGKSVTLTGLYQPVQGEAAGGTLFAETVAPDLLAIDPTAYFGGGVSAFIVEDYVEVVGGRVRLARGSLVGGGASFDGQQPGRAVLSFQRRGADGLAATRLERSNRSTSGWIPDSLNGRPLGGGGSPLSGGPALAGNTGRRSGGRGSDRFAGSAGRPNARPTFPGGLGPGSFGPGGDNPAPFSPDSAGLGGQPGTAFPGGPGAGDGGRGRQR